MALSCLEPWPGLGVRWAERARLAGWLCCRVRGGAGYGFSRKSEMYRGVLGREFSAFHGYCSCRKYWRSIKMPKNSMVGWWSEPCHLYPWISNQDFRCMAGPGGSCVYFCVVCVAACLPGGPCLLQNWFWGGVLGTEGQRRYENCRCVILSRSLDYLWVAYEMLRQQHEAILIWHFKKTKCLFFGLSRELKLHYELSDQFKNIQPAF